MTGSVNCPSANQYSSSAAFDIGFTESPAGSQLDDPTAGLPGAEHTRAYAYRPQPASLVARRVVQIPEQNVTANQPLRIQELQQTVFSDESTQVRSSYYDPVFLTRARSNLGILLIHQELGIKKYSVHFPKSFAPVMEGLKPLHVQIAPAPTQVINDAESEKDRKSKEAHKINQCTFEPMNKLEEAEIESFIKENEDIIHPLYLKYFPAGVVELVLKQLKENKKKAPETELNWNMVSTLASQKTTEYIGYLQLKNEIVAKIAADAFTLLTKKLDPNEKETQAGSGGREGAKLSATAKKSGASTLSASKESAAGAPINRTPNRTPRSHTLQVSGGRSATGDVSPRATPGMTPRMTPSFGPPSTSVATGTPQPPPSGNGLPAAPLFDLPASAAEAAAARAPSSPSSQYAQINPQPSRSRSRRGPSMDNLPQLSSKDGDGYNCDCSGKCTIM